ncbi:MAG TPA: hypothetical protein VHZ07_28250 [Bryobacteraceae bacterium]|jgi:hypothetical protein|nr:hypothetical protein [Bryobacteraceae bacterium]
MGSLKGVTKYSWQLLYLFNCYKEQTGVEVVNLEDVYEWATTRGEYVEPPTSSSARFKRDMSRALRSQHHLDPQSREVRTHLPVVRRAGRKAVVLWADSRTARPEHVDVHLQQGRLGIAQTCKRHKVIRDSSNDNNLFGAQLRLYDYNFVPDVEESGFPTDYPDEKPKI